MDHLVSLIRDAAVIVRCYEGDATYPQLLANALDSYADGFQREWRRRIYDALGNETTKSQWYEGDDGEAIVRAMVNREYPEPSSTGFRWIIESRWVSEARPEKARK